ncbi:MAG: hypothetical protein WB822_18640 [Rhodoplanes sp.]
MIAASKINCEFLAPDRWKVEGKQRIVAHGGCGAGLIQIATRSNTDLLRESLVSCHSRRSIPHRQYQLIFVGLYRLFPDTWHALAMVRPENISRCTVLGSGPVGVGDQGLVGEGRRCLSLS